MMSTLEQLNFDNTFTQLPEIFFSEHKPKALSEDFVIHFNSTIAELLSIDEAEVKRYMQVIRLNGHSK